MYFKCESTNKFRLGSTQTTICAHLCPWSCTILSVSIELDIIQCFILKVIVTDERNHTKNNNSLSDLENMFELDNSEHSGKINEGDFFCGPPDEQYARVVLESLDKSDLFTMDSLLIQCRMEHNFIASNHYRDLCIETVGRGPKKCCRPWSLGNYIAQLYNRSSCLAIMVSVKLKYY